MSEFKRYRRSNIAEMRPYVAGEVLPESVSINEADRANGCPRAGDMIARNPCNHGDQWLVAQQYFYDNFCTDAVRRYIVSTVNSAGSSLISVQPEVAVDATRAMIEAGMLFFDVDGETVAAFAAGQWSRFEAADARIERNKQD